MVTRTKKIFVGGLSAPTTLEDVKSYFEQFGPVSKIFIFIQIIYTHKNLIINISKNIKAKRAYTTQRYENNVDEIIFDWIYSIYLDVYYVIFHKQQLKDHIATKL